MSLIQAQLAMGIMAYPAMDINTYRNYLLLGKVFWLAIEVRLSSRLKRNGIEYVHFKELGGLRKPSKESINMGWRNESFRGFADYMQTRAFASAVLKLIGLSRKHTLAMMCAEGNPFRCHRSLIADALTVRGRKVYHISGISGSRPHELTSFAKVKGTKITYPKSWSA